MINKKQLGSANFEECEISLSGVQLSSQLFLVSMFGVSCDFHENLFTLHNFVNKHGSKKRNNSVFKGLNERSQNVQGPFWCDSWSFPQISWKSIHPFSVMFADMMPCLVWDQFIHGSKTHVSHLNAVPLKLCKEPPVYLRWLAFCNEMHIKYALWHDIQLHKMSRKAAVFC